jgi:hypothetical protein
VVRLWPNERISFYSDPEEQKAAGEYDYWGDDYYTNPYKAGYLDRHASALLQVVVSDVGLTVKRPGTTYWVFANHLQTTKPWPASG